MKNSLFIRNGTETEKDYIIRVCQNKGIYTWPELCDIMNSQLGYSYSSSRYRNIYTKHLKNEIEDEIIESESEGYDTEAVKLRTLLVKFREERNAYNRSITLNARREYLEEIVTNEIKKMKPYSVYPVDWPLKPDDKDMIVCLNDIHYGIEIDNFWNKYNPEIAKKRLDKYLRYIKEAAQTFNPQNCFLTLGGDNISGTIHYTIAIANRENVIQQIMGVSELVSWFASELSGIFRNVKIICQSGNHSRINSDKKLAPKDERLDDLLPWYMKARLSSIKNIEILDHTIDNTFSVFQVKGNNYLLVHGDYDRTKNINRVLEMLNVPIKAILFAHNHHNQLTYRQNQQVIASGSLMGIDDYCIEKRIIGIAQQIICIVTKEGIEYIRDCNLQEV